MFEKIRALIFIMVLAYIAFVLLKPSAKELQFDKEIKSWISWWYVTTILTFTLGSSLFLIILLYIILLTYRGTVDRKLALYAFLLLSLPILGHQIPGFGIVNYIMVMSWPRVLALALLVPLYIARGALFNKTKERLVFDKLILIYIIYISLLSFRGTTLTDGLRDVLYFTLDIYIPYLVFSTFVKNKKQFILIQYAIFSIAILISLIAIFESLKSWQIYATLNGASSGSVSAYKFRGGGLRPSVTLGAINVGLLITVAFAFGISLFNNWKITKLHLVYAAVLGLALLLTLSRGPWVGMAVIILTYMVISPNKTRHASRIGIVILLAVPFIAFTGAGERFYDLLPGVGDDKEGNISYRQELLSTSIEVINESPLTGSTAYLQHPKMLLLIQGEGIVDIVNTYIQIGLEYGYIGMLLFISIFLGITYRVLKVTMLFRRKGQRDYELIGMSLVTSYASVLFIIGTVSSLNGSVAILYWSLAGLGVAYIRMAKNILST